MGAWWIMGLFVRIFPAKMTVTDEKICNPFLGDQRLDSSFTEEAASTTLDRCRTRAAGTGISTA
jgi:hypothetical protein